MNALLATFQTIDVSNAICYCALLLALAFKTDKWCFPRLYDELLESVAAHFRSKSPRHYIPVHLFIEKASNKGLLSRETYAATSWSVNKIASSSTGIEHIRCINMRKGMYSPQRTVGAPVRPSSI
jgi:hypothetical protein